jgi:hypothetical protein
VCVLQYEDLEGIKTEEDAIVFFRQYFPDVAKDNFKLMPNMARLDFEVSKVCRKMRMLHSKHKWALTDFGEVLYLNPKP